MSSGSSSPGSRSMSPQPVRHEVLLGASVPHSPFHNPYHPIPFPDIHEMATFGSAGRNNPTNFSRHFPIHRIPRNSPRPNNKHHNAPDWQTTRCKVAERGKHLLDSGIWSDCEFIVGLPPNIKVWILKFWMISQWYKLSNTVQLWAINWLIIGDKNIWNRFHVFNFSF